MTLRLQLVTVAAIAVAVGCQTPHVEPVETVPLRPQAHEALKVEHLLVVVDSSGSIDRMETFPSHKAVVESFVQSLPDGEYQASQVAFGGYQRQVVAHATYDRDSMNEAAAALTFLDEGTQLDRVLLESREELQDVPGTAALVIFSDGHPTAPGGWHPIPEETLDAARTLVKSREDLTCFFTVQTTGDPEGAEFLKALSEITSCGAYRTAEGLDNIAGLHDFTRKIFLGKGLPDVAASAAVADTDGDGVVDAKDACPGTPLGAEVFADGCWAPPTIYFGSGSFALPANFEPKVDSVYQVLEQNPDMKVRIDGYTDATGPKALNEKLSAQRSRAVSLLLEQKGIGRDRISVRNLGESNSPYSNDSPEDRAANRRVEFVFSP
jgi:outer membrane protein OmpA-like peptidoglycan-associated protein/Mg-chelatase subunit ChlD